MKHLLTLDTEPSYEAIRKLRQQLEQSLEGFFTTLDFTSPILVCLAEIATNFVEHSRDCKQISVQLGLKGQVLILRVTEIATHNNQLLLQEWLDQPAADPFSDALDSLRSGGRGQWIIQQNCNQVNVISSGKNTTEFSTERWRNGFELQWLLPSLSLRPQILVVEDGKSQNALYCAFLTPKYHPIAAFSAKDALAALAQQHIDLVLCDMQMPDRSGLELRQTLNHDAHHASLPFILTSAHEHKDILDCMRIGIDDFLPKPLQKGALNTCIERVLTRNKQLKKDVTKNIQRGIHASLQANIPETLGHWQTALCSLGNSQGGGDLLVWEQQGDQSLIILADVMGHDEAAKFFSHAYLGYIRGFLSAQPTLPNPAVFLNALSHSLHTDHLLSSSMCTCCAMSLGPKGNIEIASAGHPLPWLIDQDAATELGDGGIMPGLQANIDYTSRKFTLMAGQRIALFTDGLLDERSKIDGNYRILQQELCRLGDSTLAETARKTFEQAISLQQGPLDDALLLLLEPLET